MEDIFEKIRKQKALSSYEKATISGKTPRKALDFSHSLSHFLGSYTVADDDMHTKEGAVMKGDLAKLFASITPNSVLRLPKGEHNGSHVINVPCTVVGMCTTIWNNHGTAITIGAPNVKLQNLRIESTDGYAISTRTAQVELENVEIFGKTEGFGAESDKWFYPSSLDMGQFCADVENEFMLEIYVPVDAVLECDIEGVEVLPKRIKKGRNLVTLRLSAFRKGTYLYGNVYLHSLFVRRISVVGHTIGVAPKREGLLYTPPIESGYLLKKGERVSVDFSSVECTTVKFNCKMSTRMDLKMYAVLLGKNGKAISDESLVFFGNRQSSCGGVRYNGEGNIEILPHLLGVGVDRIELIHSIYGENPSENFSRIRVPTVDLYNGSERTHSFLMEGLFMERIVISVSLYRYKGGWRIAAVGSGYRGKLSDLYMSYGLLRT